MDTPKIQLTQKDILRRIAMHIPFVLLVVLAIALLGGGSMLLIYSFVAVAAMKSAMVFMIIFGGSVLAIGIGLGCIEAFKIYLSYYNEKEKFIERAPKTEIKKNPLSFSNICFYIMVLGSVCVLISAALGSMKPENWATEKSDYMAENGYYAESTPFSVSYDIDYREIDKISLDLQDKNAVVVYTDNNNGRVEISGYIKYDNELCSSCGNGIVQVWETNSPKLDRAKEKFLFFLFSDNEVEAQIKISIPLYFKDMVEIEGAHIIAVD